MDDTPCIDCPDGIAHLPAHVCESCQSIRLAIAQSIYTDTPLTTWLHPKPIKPAAAPAVPATPIQERLL